MIFSDKNDIFQEQRARMVEDQVRRRGVTDSRVLEAMRKVPRHLFVPAAGRGAAYDDCPLDIGFNQTISQPYIVAFMTEILRLGPEDRVLEIGTGSGYQAAVLGELVRAVYSVETVEPLVRSARERLAALRAGNIFIRYGDGYQGWPEHAPFHAVIVTAAPVDIPRALVQQLRPGGRMIIPVGAASQELVLITRTVGGYDQEPVLPVRFVPMVPGDPPPKM